MNKTKLRIENDVLCGTREMAGFRCKSRFSHVSNIKLRYIVFRRYIFEKLGIFIQSFSQEANQATEIFTK